MHCVCECWSSAHLPEHAGPWGQTLQHRLWWLLPGLQRTTESQIRSTHPEPPAETGRTNVNGSLAYISFRPLMSPVDQTHRPSSSTAQSVMGHDRYLWIAFSIVTFSEAGQAGPSPGLWAHVQPCFNCLEQPDPSQATPLGHR